MANDAGEILWTEVPLGDSHFGMIAPGFSPFVVNVTIRSDVQQNIEAALKLGCLECVAPEVKTVQMPYSSALDLPAASPPKPAKRKWRQIFR